MAQPRADTASAAVTDLLLTLCVGALLLPASRLLFKVARNDAVVLLIADRCAVARLEA